jgi:hypothetical protein
MANLPESSTYDAGVYQIEIYDQAIGGASGIANKAATNLANRTVYLKSQTDSFQATQRKPRKLFKKLFDSASGVTAIKAVILGDSLATMKANHWITLLQRKIGGVSMVGVNVPGTILNYPAGADLSNGTITTGAAESLQYQYSPTGGVIRLDAGGSVPYTYAGVNPTFTDLKVYYIKEPSAGTINLVVNGTTVATASAANSTVQLGVLTYTHALEQVTVGLSVSGAPVRVINAHFKRSDINGVDNYSFMAIGGLLLSNSTSSPQGLALWAAIIADIAPDFVSFEMDDDFGDGGTNDAAWVALSGMLTTNAQYADKLVIGSTPRSTNDNLKIRSGAYLRSFCVGSDASYLFFDSYNIMGTYADMDAIFGTDDGTHPVSAAQAYAAEIIWNFLGLNSCYAGVNPRAINDASTPSKLGRNSSVTGPGGYDLQLNTDAVFGYDWEVNFPRSISFKSGMYGGYIPWQFSANSGLIPNVMPITVDFNYPGDVKKMALDSSSGYEFTHLIKTDNPSGSMNLQIGLLKTGFTRAQLLALGANSLIGAVAFCTDCAATGGAQLVYARGGSPTDWVTVDGKLAI